MGQIFLTKLPDITIKQGEVVSDILTSADHYGDSYHLMIVSPELDNSVHRIQIAGKISAVASDDWDYLVDDNENDVNAPASQRARRYPFAAWPSFRIAADAPVTDDRVFKVFKIWEA